MTASVVALSTPPPQGQSGKEADRFAARLQFASETAITSGTMIGLELTPTDFTFYRFERGLWAPLEGTAIRNGAFSDDVSVTFDLVDEARLNEPPETVDDEDTAPAPNIFFTPTGETTPVSIEFIADRRRTVMRLGHAGDLEVVRHDSRQ